MTQLSSDLPITLMNSQYEMHLPFTFPSSSSTVAGIASDSFTEQVRPTFSPHGETIISVNEMSMIDSAMATEKTHTAKSEPEFLTASSGKTANIASASFRDSIGEWTLSPSSGNSFTFSEAQSVLSSALLTESLSLPTKNTDSVDPTLVSASSSGSPINSANEDTSSNIASKWSDTTTVIPDPESATTKEKGMQITLHTEYSTTSVHEITNATSMSFVFSDQGNEMSVLTSSLTGDSLPGIDAIGLSSFASEQLSLLPSDNKLSPETFSEQPTESEASIQEEAWSGPEKMSTTLEEKFTNASSLYSGETSVILTKEMVSSSITYHTLKYGSSVEDDMVSENLSSYILSTSRHEQVIELTTVPISVGLPSERLTDEHHSPSQYENSFSREQTPNFLFSSETLTHNQEITSVTMLERTITQSIRPTSVEDTINQFESLTESVSLFSSGETLKASASSPVSASGTDVSSVANVTSAVPVASLYGDNDTVISFSSIRPTPQTELVEKTHFLSSSFSSTLTASLTETSLLEPLSITAKYTILTEETAGFVSSVQLASTLYDSSTLSSLLTTPQGETLPETFSVLGQIESSAFDTVAIQSSSIELSSVSFEFGATVLPSSFSELDVSALEFVVIPSSSLEISSIETVVMLATSSELSSLDTVVWHSSSSETPALDKVPKPYVSPELTSMDTLVTHSSPLEVITTMVEHSLSSELSPAGRIVTSSFLSLESSPEQTETAVEHSLSPELESMVNYLSSLDSFSLGTVGNLPYSQNYPPRGQWSNPLYPQKYLRWRP